jgi:uncharacterized protein (UPF0276 family)
VPADATAAPGRASTGDRPAFAPRAAGIGLRANHHADVLATMPAVGFFEAHAENYFAAGGTAPHCLRRVRERWPLSLHGVGLSLGSVDPLDREHLAQLARLVRDYDPVLVSEHACWGRIDGTHYNDLFPLPYTGEALRHLATRVAEAQDALGRRLLIENVSSYLEFRDAELTEWDFLAALVDECDCGLLLDVNNVYVSARNHGFDPQTFLAALPVAAVGEIHLAGHSRVVHGTGEILIDTHGTHVCDDVWALYADALRRFGDVPTLIEWDTDLPALDVLVEEARRADRVRSTALEAAA